MSSQKNTLILHALKYATYTTVAVIAVGLLIALFRSATTVDSNNLTGRALNAQESGQVPLERFNAERARTGFTVPADTHVIFTVPEGVRISAAVFLGGRDTWKTVRYWYYCFSGNELANKEQGKALIYDGKFGFSQAEIDARKARPAGSNSLIDILQESERIGQPDNTPISNITIFDEGETCYVMTSAALPAGVDDDQDDLNNAWERTLGTDPTLSDTDADGASDGREVFYMKTSPTSWDSDGDNLSDTFEDKDKDGQVDPDETSAILADTDRDELCDGDGTGPHCPEPRSSPVRGEDLNQNGVVDDGETDPKLKDTDGNGIPDYDQKLYEFDFPTNL